jgi:transposase
VNKRVLQKQNKALLEENAGLRQEIARLQARVVELEERLGQSSRNSSKPPSSDPPSAPAAKNRAPSGRHPGAQKNHPKHERTLFPPERVENTIPVKPERCKKCRGALHGQDPNPLRHQVIDLPPIQPKVTEYQLHALLCKACKILTRADLPAGVPRGVFSPRVAAIASLLTSVYHLGRRTAAAAMGDLFGIPMSVGSLSRCEQLTSAALKEPVAEAHAYVKAQTVKNSDETSWYEGASRKKAWLWTAFTEQVTVFLIRAGRGTEVAKELLGPVLGVLITDRWCAYAWWPTAFRQICWAHLKRHFQAFVDWGGSAQPIGQALLAETRQLFTWWRRVRDGTLTRSSFRSYVVALRARVKALLEQGAACGHAKTMSMCREMLTLEPAMWTFVRVTGVEPTNNAAERVIRALVIWRKICFGTHSPEGSRFVERMMTAACTLKQQDRNVVAYVTTSVEAAMNGQRPPSLLPQNSTP